MSNEIHVFYQSGLTLYSVIRNSAGQVWYVTGEVFETWGTGARTADDYDISLTDKSGGMFVGDFDANISTGNYFIATHQQAGANPDDSDPLIWQEYGYWDSSAWNNLFTYLMEIHDKLPDEYIMGSSDTESHDDEIDAILGSLGQVHIVENTTGIGGAGGTSAAASGIAEGC